jgi:hypothetical protein
MLHVLFIFSLKDLRYPSCLLYLRFNLLRQFNHCYYPIHNCLHTYNLFHKYLKKFNNTVIQCNYHSLTHSLTHSWSWALLEKPSIVQPLKNFPAFYGTRRFITGFTKALHWSLPWVSSIHSIPPHPISLRSILIFSTQLCVGLPSGLFPSGYPTKILYAFLFSPFVLYTLPISSSFTLSF